MEQLKEGVAEMDVDDGQERGQDQQQEELPAEASETVGERSGVASGGGGGGVLENMKKKFGELRRRIGERILMRSKVSGEIRIIGEKDKQEEGEEMVKLEEVVGVRDVVELEVEVEEVESELVEEVNRKSDLFEPHQERITA